MLRSWGNGLKFHDVIFIKPEFATWPICEMLLLSPLGCFSGFNGKRLVIIVQKQRVDWQYSTGGSFFEEQLRIFSCKAKSDSRSNFPDVRQLLIASSHLWTSRTTRIVFRLLGIYIGFLHNGNIMDKGPLSFESTVTQIEIRLLSNWKLPPLCASVVWFRCKWHSLYVQRPFVWGRETFLLLSYLVHLAMFLRLRICNISSIWCNSTCGMLSSACS